MTPEELATMFKCVPSTGKIYWLERHGGREAFTSVSKGYLYGRINGKSYQAHRVIWALLNGEWPKDQIDHINGNRQDNRIYNLREVSCGDNRKNSARMSTNKSGVTGVYWHKRAKQWRAAIKVDGIDRHLGYFRSLEDAKSARKLAEMKYGFHPNHGRPLVDMAA